MKLTYHETDIHNYPLRLQHALDLVRQSSHIRPRNKALIFQFYADCSLQGLTKGRLSRLMDTMTFLARATQSDFDKASIDDVKQLVRSIEGRDFTAWTKSTINSYSRSSTNGSRETMKNTPQKSNGSRQP